MCVASYVPLERKDGTWFFEKECTYNPYISKWKGEEGYLTLAESGIIVNKKGVNINLHQLNEKIEALYGAIFVDA